MVARRGFVNFSVADHTGRLCSVSKLGIAPETRWVAPAGCDSWIDDSPPFMVAPGRCDPPYQQKPTTEKTSYLTARKDVL